MSATLLFLLTLLLPWAGAAFALVLPPADRLTLRAVGVVASALALAAGAALTAEGGATLGVPFTRLTLAWAGPAVPAALAMLAVTPVALRAGAPRVEAGLPAYVVAVLGAEALGLLSVVLVDVRAAVGAATVAAVPLFAVVALFGGPQRGTVTYRAAGLWLLVDAAALAALVLLPAWRGPVLVLAALGPGLVRLAAGPWGLWALPVLEQAPIAAACLVGGVVGPTGAVLLARVAAVPGVAPADVLDALAPVLAVAGVVGAALVVAERELRRLTAHVLGLLGALAAVGLLADAAPRALALVTLTGSAASLALVVVEAIERRLETRRVHELAGLLASAPLLGLLLPLALLALSGLPGLGVGVEAWGLVAALARHPSPAVGASGLSFGAALLVTSAAAVVVAGRTALPHRRRHHEVRVSFPQGIRLLVPLAALVAASALSGRLAGERSGALPGSPPEAQRRALAAAGAEP